MRGSTRRGVRTALLAMLAALVAAPAAAGASDEHGFVLTSWDGIVRVLAPNGAQVRVLDDRSASGGGAYSPSFSPDGAAVAYTASGGGPSRLVTVPVEGGTPTTVVTDAGAGAWGPDGRIAVWQSAGGNRSLRLVQPDGSGGATIAGPFPASDTTSPGGLQTPAWSPDGTRVAFALTSSAIASYPVAGGAPSVVVPAGPPATLVAYPAYSPDGTRIAFLRGSLAGGDRIVVRNLATAAEVVAWQAPDGYTSVASATPAIAWSADSSRIAFVELYNTSPSRYRLETVKADGTSPAPQVLREENRSIAMSGVAWDASVAPSYYVRHVDVVQAVGSATFNTMPADAPLSPTPIVETFVERQVSGYPVQLVAGKETLVRIYVGDASLAPGATAARTLGYRVSIGGGAPITGTGSVSVTEAGSTPAASSADGALNVWLPASAAVSGTNLTVEVEVNPGETETECAGCYPNGNEARIEKVRFHNGGGIAVTPVPITFQLPGGKTFTPDPEFGKLWDRIGKRLPIADLGVTVLKALPGITIDAQKLGLLQPNGLLVNDVCDETHATLLLALKAAGGAPAPTAGGTGAGRYIGYGSPRWGPGPGCLGGTTSKGIVLFSTNGINGAHELGHSFGLPHVKTAAGIGVNPAPPIITLGYTGLGAAVGYEHAENGTTVVLPSAATEDLMAYAPQTWLSPWSWSELHDRILKASPAITPNAPRRGLAAAAAGPGRIVAGVLRADGAQIVGSVRVDSVRRDAPAGTAAGSVAALDAAGKVLATAPITGTLTSELPGSAPGVPFAVVLPPTPTAASLVIRDAARKPLLRLRASRHAPTARIVGLPRKAVRASAHVKARVTASDRDGGTLTIVASARRGTGPWRVVGLLASGATLDVVPREVGATGRLRLRLVVSDGLRSRTVTSKAIAIRR